MLGATLRGKAVSDCEIYTPTGVLTGTADVALVTAEGRELIEPFTVAGARWYPLDGEPPSQRALARLEPDDMLIVVTPAPELFVHLTRYAIALEVGPYRILGSLATQPGFDPEKSIARPGGSFVPLSDVTIELLGHPEAGSAERPHVHVNRYAVESVVSPIMLGHFFPGAQLETHPVPVAVPA
jgi:hypothetical protein